MKEIIFFKRGIIKYYRQCGDKTCVAKKCWNLAGESLFTLMLKCIFRFMWTAVNHSAFIFNVILMVKEKESNKQSNMACRNHKKTSVWNETD